MGAEPAWRIDALDARGGLAFATWRGPDNDVTVVKGAETYPRCIFIGAPSFRPEVVVNRSIALSSTRGLFQFGLYSDDVEITFPTVAAVVEFVRRTYLSGAGGDGSDDGGGEALPWPREPPGLPGMPGEFVVPEAESSLVKSFADALHRFASLSDVTSLDEATPIESWPSPAGQGLGLARQSDFDDGLDVLVFAAATLILDLLCRLPLAGDNQGLVHWTRSANSLGAAVRRLGLWPSIVLPTYSKNIEHLIFQMTKRGGQLPILKALTRFKLPQEDVCPFLLRALFCDSAALFDSHYVQKYYELNYWPFVKWAHWTAFGSAETIDPATSLERIPVPHELVKFCGAADRDGDPNLLNLVSVFLGSPLMALRDRRLFAIALFVASSIANDDTPPELQFAWHDGSLDRCSAAHSRWVQSRANAGWNWLLTSLPKLAFAKGVEDLILSAANMRYRSQKETDPGGDGGTGASSSQTQRYPASQVISLTQRYQQSGR